MTRTSTGSAAGWACSAPRAGFDEAHDEMLAITPPEDAYELHINLIRHGRALCRPRPRCDECELRRMCPTSRTSSLAVTRAPVSERRDSAATDEGARS